MGKSEVLDKYFSKELTYVLDYIIDNVHEDMQFNEISPYIFLYSALEKQESMLYTVLSSYLITEMIDNIHDELVSMEHKHSLSKEIADVNRGKIKPELSRSLRAYLNDSLIDVRETGAELINTDHVLLSILRDNEDPAYDNDIITLFREYGVTYKVLFGISKNLRDTLKTNDKSQKTPDVEPGEVTSKSDQEKNKTKEFIDELVKNIKIIDKATNGNAKTLIIGGPSIPQDEIINMLGIGGQTKTNTQKGNGKSIPYCTNINDQVKKNKFDAIVGREKELNEIFRVLGRRKTNNAILVGDSGVGKTQIVVGVAQKILSGEAPIMFKDKEVWKFNPTEMLAGTTLRGMFEERMVAMTKALKDNKNAILFIDDIDNLFAEKTKGDYDAGGVISELFSNGDVQVIATTDFKGYKTLCDTNPGISKKLQKVSVDALNEDDTYNILKDNRKYYEDFHNVTYSDSILKLCIDLSKRYITEKTLPSSAIDVMDELGSYKKMNNDLINSIRFRYKVLEEIKEAIETASKKDDFDKVREYGQHERDIRCDLAQLEEEQRSKKKLEVTEEDLYTTISQHTNIPIGKLKSSEKTELRHIDEKLKEIIIGQDEAIDIVSRAIKRNKIGLHQNNRPMGCFMFVGQTGTGKTLLAKTLAKEIFGDEKYLIRFDMSEYNDKTSVNKLIGASAGYVGYNEGGLLTESVKRNKYAVLLIDEIEKATEEIYNLFLQVFDEGFLTDNTGQKVDFKNTIIILTSNVGTKKAGQHKALGFAATEDDSVKHGIIEKEIKDKFPPEFINRLDEIVYFNNLDEDNLKEIIKLEMKKLEDRVKNVGYSISYKDDVVDFLLKKIKDEKEYGARPIIRTIRDNIENKITDLIIDNFNPNVIFSITVNGDEVKVEETVNIVFDKENNVYKIV
jgi:ATP-dependent Clp protease ATP-binding subunit ClpC